MPVIRKAHHAQFLAMPFSRTMPVTRLGVSAEKVQATIETPRSHQGMLRPPRKNWLVLRPALRDAARPMLMTMTKKMPIMAQSMVCKCMVEIG